MSDYKVKHDDHEAAEDTRDIGEDLGMTTIWGLSISFFFFCVAISAWLVGIFGKVDRHEIRAKVYDPGVQALEDLRTEQTSQLGEYKIVDAVSGHVTVPITEAMGLALRELINQERNPPQPTMLLDGTTLGTEAGSPAAEGDAPVEGENPCAAKAAQEVSTEQADSTENPCHGGTDSANAGEH